MSPSVFVPPFPAPPGGGSAWSATRSSAQAQLPWVAIVAGGFASSESHMCLRQAYVGGESAVNKAGITSRCDRRIETKKRAWWGDGWLGGSSEKIALIQGYRVRKRGHSHPNHWPCVDHRR